MGKPAYATVEQVAQAIDIAATAYETDRLKRIVFGASRKIDRELHRHFYPITEARTYWITGGVGFWLDADLLSLSTLTADDVSIDTSDVDLWPADTGPPYKWIEQSGATIVVTGDWGFSNDTETAGGLDSAISDTTGTSVVATNSAVIGVGDLIICESERMIVTAKTLSDTAATNEAALTAAKNDVTVTVDDGTLLNVDEIIQIDSEEMWIRAISSNTLTVERAVNGTVLATHAGSSEAVNARRTLTVERGAAGSTAATHADTTALTRNVPPYVITNWTVAEAIVRFEQETFGFAQTIGSGETAREARYLGLEDARREAQVYTRIRVAAI